MITTILSKGAGSGRLFVTYNDITKKYHIGNSASTAVSFESAHITIDGVTNKTVRNVAQRLENMGYSEHKVVWNTDEDPYYSIKKNLLARD